MKSKKIIACMLILGIMSILSSNVKAYENSDTILFNSKNQLIEGEVLSFKSVDDETGTQNAGLPPSIRIRQTSGIIYEDSGWYGSSYLVERTTATGDSTIRKEFVKYLTGSWAPAASYTWSKSNSTTWTFGGEGTSDISEKVRIALNLSRSRTTTYDVAINIPADSTRLSKLGFASDYFKQNYKYQKIVDGVVTSTKNGYIKTPTKDTYLLVYFQ